MLSKNNFKERLRKMEAKKERFSIRKLSVGAASVLIGFFIMGFGNQTVHAETVEPNSKPNEGQDSDNVETAEKTTQSKDSAVQEADTNTLKKVANEKAASKEQNHDSAKPEATQQKPATILGTQNKKTDASDLKAAVDYFEQNFDSMTESEKKAAGDHITEMMKKLGVSPFGVFAANAGSNATQSSFQNLSAHGVKLPERDISGTNKNYFALNLKPDSMSADSTDNNLKFSMTELHGFYTGVNIAAGTKNYELHIQLDDRLKDYVTGINLSAQGDVNANLPAKTAMIKDADGSWKLPLFGHNSMKNDQGKNVSGVIGSANTGRAFTNPSCVIEFNTQIGNVVKDLKDKGVDIVNDPLVYGVYAYNKETKKQIGNDGSTGFILSSEDPFANLPVDKDSTTVATNQPYFQSANAWAAYDKNTNSIDVFYNPIKLGAWAWDGYAKGRGVAYANYQIDPALAPYIKSASYYYVPLNSASSPFNSENGFNFSMGTKVADMPVGSAESQNPGFSQFEIDNSYLGHSVKNPTFGIAGGDSGFKVYSRASFQLNAPVDQVMKALNDKGVNVKALQMGAYITGKDKSGNNNHLMSPNTLGLDSFNLAAQVEESVLHQPSYAPADVKQGESKEVIPTWPVNGVINENGVPTDATFTTIDGQTPDWVTVKTPTDGTITIAPKTDTSVGMYNVPLKVTFAGDGSTSTVNVPVYVTDGNEQVNWGKDKNGNTTGAVVVTTAPAALKAHETSDNSMNLVPSDAVKSIDEYKIGTTDPTTGEQDLTAINTTPTNIAKNATGVSIAWDGTAPSTTVNSASLNHAALNGSVKVSFANTSAPFTDGVLGKDGATSADSVSAINIPVAGATGVKPATPVTVTVGTETSQDDFAKLVNHSELDNAGIKDYTYSWATEPKAGDTKGTVRITFTDKAANGNATYLDVETPEGSLNVVNGTHDKDKYEPSYNPVAAPQGQITNDPVQWDKNGQAPEGTSFTKAPTVPDWVTVDPTTGNITLTPTDSTPTGTYDIPVTVTYPDNSTETKTATVTVTGTGDQSHHVYYGDQSTVDFSADAVSTHKTDKDNELVAADHGFTKIVYQSDYNHDTGEYGKTTTFTYDAAKKAFVGDDANKTEIPASDITYTWQSANGVVTPNTNWQDIKSSAVAATTGTTLANSEAEMTQVGESLPGNSKYRYDFSLNADGTSKLGLPSNYNSWANAYYNFYGATPKDDASLEIKASEGGVDKVSSDTLGTLINHQDLTGSGDKNQGVKDYSWGTKPTFDKDGKLTNTPSVQINFNNGTTLTVPVSDAEKKNITFNNDTQSKNFTQDINFVDDKNNALGSTSVTGTYTDSTPGSVSAADLKTAIDKALKDNSALKGWVVAGDYPAEVTGINSANPTAITVTLKRATTEADKYTPSYNGISGKPGETKTSDVTYTGDKPTDATYKIGDNSPIPATVADNGTVSVTIPTDAKPGTVYNVPVTVTYTGDNSTDTAYVPVVVTDEDGNTQVNWGKNGAVVVTTNPGAYKAHETSENSSVFDANKAITSVVEHKLDKDGKLEETGTPVTGVTAEWTSAPSTVVPTATATGVKINGSMNITLPDSVKTEMGLDNNVVSASVNNIDAKGAGAKDLSTPVTVVSGQDLTDDQFSQLVENNIPTDEIASKAWKTAPEAGQDATIEITFKDNDKDGKPTYLDITIPSKNLNVDHVVTPNPDPTKDTDPNHKGMYTEVDRQVTITDPNGKTDAAKSTTQKLHFGRQMVAGKDGKVDTSFNGTINGVEYENGYAKWTPEKGTFASISLDPTKKYNGHTYYAYIGKDKVTKVPELANVTPGQTVAPVNVIYSTTEPSDADAYTPTYPQVVTTPGEKTTVDVQWPDGKKPTGKVTYEITPGSNVPTWVTVDPTTGTITIDAPKDTPTEVINVPVTVTYPDNTTDKPSANVVIVAGQPTSDPTDPTKGIKDPDNLPGGSTITWGIRKPDPKNPDTQTVDINVSVPDPKDPTKVTTVTVPVTYTPTSEVTPTPTPTPSTPTDADTYDPQGQDIKTPEGVVPDPSQGISNKDQLPGGTTYTWQDPGQVTGDVKTPGSHPEVIVVTYPDGSQDTVTVTVNVPAPEPQDIHTPESVVPNPSEGIKNPDEMPDGTNYTWKNPDKVANDVKTPGSHTETIVVTFPDGTKYEVETTIVVAENTDENSGIHDQGNGNGNGSATGVHGQNYVGKHEKTLPQTGSKANNAGVFGLALAAIAGFFGIAGDKKRKRN